MFTTALYSWLRSLSPGLAVHVWPGLRLSLSQCRMSNNNHISKVREYFILAIFYSVYFINNLLVIVYLVEYQLAGKFI